MSGPKVEHYELKHPVEVAGKLITSVNIRTRAKVKDWKGAFRDCPEGPGGEIGMSQFLALAPRMCGLLDIEWDEFDTDDMNEIVSRVAGFLAGGPPTGTTSSPSSPQSAASPTES